VPERLPPELRAFLYSCIDAVEQVEILVLLCQSDRACSAKAVASNLSVTDAVARHHLETLVARGLLQATIGAEVTYRYAPKSVELRRYGDQLVEQYTTSRTAILQTVATASRRSVKRFSDAFKLRDSEGSE
jgi:hypothetical protein